MGDEDTSGPAGRNADEKLLEEQKARIAALRAAALGGRIPDEAAFDYERFFGAPAKDEAPEP